MTDLVNLGVAFVAGVWVQWMWNQFVHRRPIAHRGNCGFWTDKPCNCNLEGK